MTGVFQVFQNGKLVMEVENKISTLSVEDVLNLTFDKLFKGEPYVYWPQKFDPGVPLQETSESVIEIRSSPCTTSSN